MADVFVYEKRMARWMCEDCGAVGTEYPVHLCGVSVARGGAAVHERNCPERTEGES